MMKKRNIKSLWLLAAVGVALMLASSCATPAIKKPSKPVGAKQPTTSVTSTEVAPATNQAVKAVVDSAVVRAESMDH